LPRIRPPTFFPRSGIARSMRDRLRTFLGVWAPLILGGLLIVFVVNFFLTATTPSGPFSRWPAEFSWDLWRSVCTGGLIVIAIILAISTLGRARSTRSRRRAWGRWYRKRKDGLEESRPPETPRPPQRP